MTTTKLGKGPSNFLSAPDRYDIPIPTSIIHHCLPVLIIVVVSFKGIRETCLSNAGSMQVLHLVLRYPRCLSCLPLALREI
jgi:hypothetical protein